MKLKLLSIVLAPLLIGGCASSFSSSSGHLQRNSLPQNVADTTEHSEWSGSAFFINAEGYLATANHVVEGGKTFKVYYNHKFYPARVIITDKQHDVAIVKTDIVPTSYLSLSSQETKTPIGVYGFPQGTLVLTMTTGGVPSYSGITESIVDVEARICHGNSGGPIINTGGDVVGQLNWGYTMEEDQACTDKGGGPTIKYIIDIAKRANVKVDIQNSTSNYSFPHIMYNYSEAIVYISGSN